MKIAARESEAFRVASLLATILVVAIHYNTRHAIPVDDALGWNSWLQTVICDGLARVAVPYFALAAGLFFAIGRFDNGHYVEVVRRRFHTIFVPYVACSLLILLPEIAYLSWFSEAGYQIAAANVLSDIFVAPIAVQFWFLRDLLVLVLVSPLIFFLSDRLAFASLPILLALWVCDVEFLPRFLDEGRPLVSIEVLFFFCVGCYLATSGGRWLEGLFARSGVRICLASIFVLSAFVLRTYLDLSSLANGENIEGWVLFVRTLFHKLGVLFGVYALFLVSREVATPYLVWLAGLNFFVYLFHGLPINRVINFTSDQFVPDDLKFYPNLVAALLISFSAAFILRRLVGPAYRFLVGGR